MRKKTNEKRQLILDAAQHTFLTCGYAATSLDTIATKAQVTKQTIYSYFPNKRALFMAVLENIVGDQVGLDIPPENIGSIDELQKTLNTIACHINEVISDPDYTLLLRIVISDSYTDPTLGHVLKRGVTARSLKTLTTIFRKAKKDGLIQIGSPSNAACLFMGGFVTRILLEGLFMHSTFKGIDKQSDRSLQAYVEDFMKLVR